MEFLGGILMLRRVWRFLGKPWPEKKRSFYFRWTSTFANLPAPLRLPFGAWWLVRGDNTGLPISEGNFENAEIAFVNRFLQPGMTVLDIGAHHGLYTLLSSRKVGPQGQVFSFEPSPRERKALLEHLKLNRCGNVRVEEFALGSEDAQSQLYVVDGKQTGCNSLRPPIVMSGTSPIPVQVRRLDDWVSEQKLDHVDLVKLDVEGGELAVLHGAGELLKRRPRPVVLAEVQDVRTTPWGYRAKDIIDHLQNLGFSWFKSTQQGELVGLPSGQNEFEGNYVAVPDEWIERISELAKPCPASSNQRDLAWDKPYETLRTRWEAVPTNNKEYLSTTKLIELSDDALLAKWRNSREAITTGPEFSHRGWYHALYADSMRGKKVMDIGSGFGVDSITFAQHGAKLTFVDLVESNLRVLERLCKIMGLKDVQFVPFKDLDSLKPLDTDYDVIMAMGSLHHAPMDILKPEYKELLRHLKIGGRWLQLAYPQSRWIREGRLPFHTWGEVTDPPGAPWAEWYDVPKLLNMFDPARFDVILYQEIYEGYFNWFDLLYRGF
jgi:FkbM family methyltransferase